MATVAQETRQPPLSQSRRELLGCEILYAERSIHGAKEAPNPYSQRGIEVHKAASDYVTHLVFTKKHSDVEWFNLDILTRPYLPDALEILEKMRDTLKVDPERVFDTELWLPLDADFQPLDVEPGDPLVAYEGTLDLILYPDPHKAIIEDYKTYWQVVDADTFQSDFYPLLLFKHFPGLEEVTFRLNFVRYGVSREKVFTRADVPKLEKMASDARSRQVGVEAKVANGKPLTATPGAHCAYCPKLRKGCPIADMNPYTESTEDRIRFGIWLNAAKKENDRVLKDLIRIGGPVQVKDANDNPYVATFELQHKNYYPAIPCLALVSANDPELAPKLKLSGLSTPLKAKKRSGLAGLLEEHRQEVGQTRFSIKGIEPEPDEDEGA